MLKNLLDRRTASLLRYLNPQLNLISCFLKFLSRLGANPIMRHLYELDIEEDEGDLGRPAFDYVRFWRFRTPVTVTDLKFSLNEFTAKKGKMLCNILKEFLDKVGTKIAFQPWSCL